MYPDIAPRIRLNTFGIQQDTRSAQVFQARWWTCSEYASNTSEYVRNTSARNVFQALSRVRSRTHRDTHEIHQDTHRRHENAQLLALSTKGQCLEDLLIARVELRLQRLRRCLRLALALGCGLRQPSPCVIWCDLDDSSSGI